MLNELAAEHSYTFHQTGWNPLFSPQARVASTSLGPPQSESSGILKSPGRRIPSRAETSVDSDERLLDQSLMEAEVNAIMQKKQGRGFGYSLPGHN